MGWYVLVLLAPHISLFVLWYRKQPLEFRKYYLIIMGLCFILYGNSLRNQYSMDDELVTLNNEKVHQGVSGIPVLWTTRYAQNNKANYEYRPLVLTSFAIEYEVFGPDVAISHFINILLYALTGVVLFHLLLQLFKNYHWILPLGVTLLFIVHPLHSEVVVSLKNRDELLCFLFGLLSLKAFIRVTNQFSWVQILWGSLAFVMAISAKLSIVTFGFIIPFTLFYFRSAKLRYTVGVFIVILVAYKVFKLVSATVLSDQDVARNLLFFENPLFSLDTTLLERLPMAFYSIGYYIKLLVVPHPLVFYYGYDAVPIANWSNPMAIISAVIVIPLTFFLIYKSVGLYIIRKQRETNIAIYGAIYFLVCISMFTNFVTPMVGIIGERFAYVASLGFCIVVIYFLLKVFKVNFAKDALLKLPSKFKIVAALVLISCTVRTIARNPAWYDHLTLYRTDIVHIPNSAKAHALIGGTLLPKIPQLPVQERLAAQQEVKEHYEKCLEIYDGYTTSWNNLGTLLFQQAEYATALTYFETAMEQDSAYVEATFNAAFSNEKLYQVYLATEYTLKGFIQVHDNEFLKLGVDSVNRSTIAAIADSLVTSDLVQQVYKNAHNQLFLTVKQLVVLEFSQLPIEQKQNQRSALQNQTKQTIDNVIDQVVWKDIVASRDIILGEDNNDTYLTNLKIAVYSETYSQYVDLNEPQKEMYLSETIRLYNMSIGFDSSYFQSIDKLGTLLIQNQMWEEAITLYSPCILNEKLNEMDVIWTNLASSYMKLGDSITAMEIMIERFEKTESLYQEALELYEINLAKSELWKPFMTPWGHEAYVKEWEGKANFYRRNASIFNNRNMQIAGQLANLCTMLGHYDKSNYYNQMLNHMKTRY